MDETIDAGASCGLRSSVQSKRRKGRSSLRLHRAAPLDPRRVRPRRSIPAGAATPSARSMRV